MDSANQLTGVTKGTDTYSFAYLGTGDRIGQTVNGASTQYALDLNAGLTQVLADGTNTYLYGNERIGQMTGVDSAYFLGDALGSVRQLTDASGAVTLNKAYEPYGQMISSQGSGTSSYGFTGEWLDGTGLVYLRARYYEVSLNQFIQQDPFIPDPYQPLDLNKFGYVRNNPINKVDPSGAYPACDRFEYCQNYKMKHPLDRYFNNLEYPLVNYAKNMSTSMAGVNFIKDWEKHEFSMYNDLSTDISLRYDRCGNGKGSCTIGYGHKIHNGPCNKDLYAKDEKHWENGLSEPSAAKLLISDLDLYFEDPVKDNVRVKITQNQFDMLVDLVYTWGEDNLKKSNLLKFLNQSQYVNAATELRNIGIYAKGSISPMPGLIRRRAAESKLFLTKPIILDYPDVRDDRIE